MKNSFKAFIAFVLAFIMMQGVYAAPGIYLKPAELRGGSLASGNLMPVVRVTPKPERVTPTPKPTPTPEPFYSDVAEDAWYYSAVKTVTQKKYMDGTNDVADDGLTFEPNGKLTRAMFVTILYRIAGSPAVAKATPTPKPTATPKPSGDEDEAEPSATPGATEKPAKAPVSFKDVKDDMWYSDAVAWATAAKIADGTDSANFSPNRNITREQAVAMLYRYAKYKKTDTSREANLLKYKDYSKIGEYAIDAFSWACGMGIIEGVGDTKKLEPTSGVTRAQAAKMIAAYTGDMPKAADKTKATEAPTAADKTKATEKPDSAATSAPKSTSTPAASGSGTRHSSSGSATAAPTTAPTATPRPSSGQTDNNGVLRLEYDDAASTSTTRVVKIYYQEVKGVYGATLVLNLSSNAVTDADIKCVQEQGIAITSNPTMLGNGKYAANLVVVSDDPVTSPDNLLATLTLTVPADAGEFTVSLDKESNIADQDFENVDCNSPSTITIPRKSS